MPKRICNRCDQKKHSYDFYDDSRNTCKECKIKSSKESYQAKKNGGNHVKSGRCKKDEDVQQSDDDLQYENKKLKKRVRKLEKGMDKMNHIISQQKREIYMINALIKGFASGLMVNQEEEVDTANVVELSE